MSSVSTIYHITTSVPRVVAVSEGGLKKPGDTSDFQCLFL